MIHSMHILETPFQIVPKSLSGAGPERTFVLYAHRERADLCLPGAEALAKALNKGFFALLDRLKLCSVPRIISAECVAAKAAGRAGQV